jgi:hypothetical protein
MQRCSARLPAFTRMNEAEAYELNLSIAPERPLPSRRMLASRLFRSDLIESLDPSNDNRA